MKETHAPPDDLAACQAILVEQARAIVELKRLAEEQKLMPNELMQRAYRQRSERYHEDPQQLKLDLGGTPEAADAAEGLAEAVEEAQIVIAEHKRRVRKPRKPGDESLPAHPPRYEVTLDAPQETKHCAERGARKLIGYDEQETLDMEQLDSRF